MKINSTCTQLHPRVAKIKLLLPALALALLGFASATKAADENQQSGRTPELPSPLCDAVQVPAGNRVSSYLFGLGVQIYHWDGTSWVFVAPEATLYADPGHQAEVGIHFAGPTWQANDGSTVVGSHAVPCTPNRGAIAWLRLEATSAPGEGRFAHLTFIQRLNTIGGTAPSTPGEFIGDEARVPYTSDYVFYRQAND
jgi:hypothetical protein